MFANFHEKEAMLGLGGNTRALNTINRSFIKDVLTCKKMKNTKCPKPSRNSQMPFGWHSSNW